MGCANSHLLVILNRFSVEKENKSNSNLPKDINPKDLLSNTVNKPETITNESSFPQVCNEGPVLFPKNSESFSIIRESKNKDLISYSQTPSFNPQLPIKKDSRVNNIRTSEPSDLCIIPSKRERPSSFESTTEDVQSASTEQKYKQIITNLYRKLQNLENQLDALRSADLNSKDSKILSLSSYVSYLESLNTQHQEKLKSLISIEALTSKNAELVSVVNSLKSENSSLKSYNNELTEGFQKLNQAYSNLYAYTQALNQL